MAVSGKIEKFTKMQVVYYQAKKKKEWMIINIQNNQSDGMHLHLISDFVNGDL